MVICSLCRGLGHEELLIVGIEAGEPYGRVERHRCLACGGRGVIPKAQREREERGRAMREERQARKKSLYEEAMSLGITVQELGRLESGREADG